MNRRGSRRSKAPDRIGRHVSAVPRFAAGMASLPAFLLMDSLLFKAVLALLFVVLALLAGKRIRWGYYLVLSSSICFFHLLAPWGRVLAEIGPLTITLGALENGVSRALTLMGMVFLSVAAVRPELELPGRLGGLLGRTFYYFEAIIDGKAELTRKNFVKGLDELLLKRFDPRKEDFGSGESPAPVPVSGRGWIPAIFFSVLPWGLWALTFADVPWI